MNETFEKNKINEYSKMNRVPLFDEFRLIERSETEINGAWKGAHLLLFFLAFVFGSFCTFCFHMLMYLFDEKCVLFPKLLSLTSLRHNVIYEFIPTSKDLGDMPVDFLSTQWVEKSTCSLPTYVPLVSGIFGLVWTTMFLMCSTGSRTLTGLQRPWRVLPPVFVFSLAMGGLCIYSSAVTHYGLQELCLKLGEITGSSTCTYTVNVATLTYERRIRGVYQATRLTILSAWLHTACWLLSALLALVRIIMAVDFQLVRINVELHGDIDRILEKHEVQIRTFSPEIWVNDEFEDESATKLTAKNDRPEEEEQMTDLFDDESNFLYFAKHQSDASEVSLHPEERNRIARIEAYKTVDKDKIFIVKWIYDLVDTLHLPDVSEEEELGMLSPSSYSVVDSQTSIMFRQFGQSRITSREIDLESPGSSQKDEISASFTMDQQLLPVDSLIIHELHQFKKGPYYNALKEVTSPKPSTSRPEDSVMNLTKDMKSIIDTAASMREINEAKQDDKDEDRYNENDEDKDEENDEDKDEEKDEDKGKGKYEEKDDEKVDEMPGKKSNLKSIGVQTGKGMKKKRSRRVKISDKTIYHESASDAETETSLDKNDVDKETQTREKEKQD